jgi:hypothetical protein
MAFAVGTVKRTCKAGHLHPRRTAVFGAKKELCHVFPVTCGYVVAHHGSHDVILGVRAVPCCRVVVEYRLFVGDLPFSLGNADNLKPHFPTAKDVSVPVHADTGKIKGCVVHALFLMWGRSHAPMATDGRDRTYARAHTRALAHACKSARLLRRYHAFCLITLGYVASLPSRAPIPLSQTSRVDVRWV